MELQEFISNFADQFEDTDASEITKNTIFKDLDEWSSLLALSVSAMAEEEYGVSFKGDDIRNASTVEDLYMILKNKS
ncbi:acyl carrier protein [Proteiniphilum propionicum]|jgi:acyl carrier protein|uniref:acyl carrier protein n=1 Tax=Proteiniphilum propionicum TaxID=2829812 RepID=UPI001799390E|nr:acyl carrier protein [Proteiniphilum propionicum]NMA30801.1 acyl carrier protein [Candidatus Methanofastidiosa archaeon]ULB33496.1 acyl carrier protein [Proteiniphilum propionicum]